MLELKLKDQWAEKSAEHGQEIGTQSIKRFGGVVSGPGSVALPVLVVAAWSQPEMVAAFSSASRTGRTLSVSIGGQNISPSNNAFARTRGNPRAAQSRR